MRWRMGHKPTVEFAGIHIPELGKPFDMNGDGKNDLCFYSKSHPKSGSNQTGVSYVEVTAEEGDNVTTYSVNRTTAWFTFSTGNGQTTSTSTPFRRMRSTSTPTCGRRIPAGTTKPLTRNDQKSDFMKNTRYNFVFLFRRRSPSAHPARTTKPTSCSGATTRSRSRTSIRRRSCLVLTNGSWKITPDDTWISCSPGGGNGAPKEQAVNITVAQNDGAERTGSVTLSDGLNWSSGLRRRTDSSPSARRDRLVSTSTRSSWTSG